ncbi:MAG: hypothetical protein CL566_04595 [Alphaproteobacteria bacterium]|nr:hypothetical protein [Alphaproteobacteria bacterium]|tara:strand:- start:171 stop:425 length:255 start_codon:yes stop_codon:yes gene_type:complete
MKVTINIDCTPEEARAFMGLPDISAAQEAVVEEWQRQAMGAMSAIDPQSLFKAWMPAGAGGDAWEQFQNSFWPAMNPDGEKPKS